ncbi:ribonuclease III [Marinicella rhabdoformis]|uniref:ribonuclease III n=1 Tax=Marinicella rhabdoformis TaxID=2580566 RepID=UPI0012AEC71D|nr:ribonuclease III [Marinicella rhabdoformis]
MNILGQPITWNDEGLLSQALTHRSVGKNNNERLEFLGDSVLSLVISTHLYNEYPQLSEGELSRLRSQLVKGKTLAEVARHYELGSKIKLGQGEIKSGGVNKSSVLADAVEAVFGAVLLDKGYSKAQAFVAEVMQPWLVKIDPSVIKKDPKSHLQEVLQKQGLALPVYKTIKEEEVKDNIEFTVSCQVEEKKLLVQSKASSRKKAEQACAEKLVVLLDE